MYIFFIKCQDLLNISNPSQNNFLASPLENIDIDYVGQTAKIDTGLLYPNNGKFLGPTAGPSCQRCQKL
jgi:hypothetical protein